MSVTPALPAGGGAAAATAVGTAATGGSERQDRPSRTAPVPARSLAAVCGARWVPAPGHGTASDDLPGDAPAGTSDTTASDAGTSHATASDDVVVTGVGLDSRRVEPGDLYAALPGAHAHGADFVAQAAARGAVAVLTDPAGAPAAASAGLPALVVDDPRAVLGEVSAQVHGHPARDLLVLGVTGTNGKTTVSTLLEGALTAAGRRSGLIGTTGSRVAGVPVGSGAGSRTTPEAPDLHALLAVMRERGVEALAMEVSSHAVVLHRVDGLVLDVIGFTQLSQDHLDFHGDMESYYAAKAQLFHPRRARHGVITVDDAWGARLAREAVAAGLPVTTVSTDGGPGAPAADWSLVPGSVRPAPGGTAFALTGPDGRATELVSPLPGGFNVANTALALVVLVTAGTAPADAAAGLAAAAGPPGRMQVVPGPAGAPRGVVDYAHTPEAVTAALGALRPTTAGALVVVLGAGGDRDRGKRPLMGAAAAAGADLVVVTDDNPRSEDPAAVRAAVLAGALAGAGNGGRAGARDEARDDAGADAVGRGGRVLEVGDRAAAIRRAVAAAGPDGTVLVAGKGHERGQEVAGRVLPFDDVEELAAALADVPRTAPGPAGPAADTAAASDTDPAADTAADTDRPPAPDDPAPPPPPATTPLADTPTTSSTGPAMTAPPRPSAPAPGAHR